MDPGVTAAAGLDQPWTSPPSVADVERIIALADPVVRNLQITQCYHELSRALARRTVSHANWCTFAVWASKQAGQTIRKEDLARALEQLWDTSSEVSVVTPSPTSLHPGQPAGDRGCGLVGPTRPHALHHGHVPLLPGAIRPVEPPVQSGAGSDTEGRTQAGGTPVVPWRPCNADAPPPALAEVSPAARRPARAVGARRPAPRSR